MRNYLQKLLAYCIVIAGIVGTSAMAQTVASNVILMPDELLTVNKPYFSPNQSHYLVFQGDGNLVIYHGATGRAVWNAGSNGADFAVMQGDGNFVVYRGPYGHPNPVPVWNSQTGSSAPNTGASEVRLYDSGRMTVRGNNGKIFDTQPPTVAPEPPCFATPYAACRNPGTPFQMGGYVFACSYLEAQRQAFLSGMTLGMCP